jgi:hypothetical protein
MPQKRGFEMAFADKQAAYKYVNEYQKAKYDRITILRSAGEKEKLDAIAKEKNLSLTQFINQCIDEKLKRMKIDI